MLLSQYLIFDIIIIVIFNYYYYYFLCAWEWGINLQGRKNIAHSRGYARKRVMVTYRIEPCIILFLTAKEQSQRGNQLVNENRRCVKLVAIIIIVLVLANNYLNHITILPYLNLST